MATTLELQLTHHLLSTAGATITAGENILFSSCLWKISIHAKEKLICFTERFLMLDSIYHMVVDQGRISTTRGVDWLEDEDHDTKKLGARVQYHLTRLDNNSSDIEYEITQTEKRACDEKVRNNEQSSLCLIRENWNRNSKTSQRDWSLG
ncbi:hypothetical protein GCK32_001989 [Trichostrongylus colubriformis]|uniref:Uncharacterized protein n=1 Tax=Trichostrongylus colubriformis TaxID=6319 RepID=A0AAN8FPU6_TRICO